MEAYATGNSDPGEVIIPLNCTIFRCWAYNELYPPTKSANKKTEICIRNLGILTKIKK